MIIARAIPDTRDTIIGQEVDIRRPIEETFITIVGISDTIDGTGDETRDMTAILAAIKQVTHSGERRANSG
jgi:hypothetical protein